MSWDRLYERLAWVARSGEPARCRHILTVLALHAADDDGSCWVSIGTLAAETGIGTTNLRRAVSDLIARGVIAVPRGRKGGGSRTGSGYLVPAFATRYPCVGRDVGAGPSPNCRASGDGGASQRPVVASARRSPDVAPTRSQRPSVADPPAPHGKTSGDAGAAAGGRATPVPERIDLDERLLAIAREAGLSTEQARRELDACLDWHRANGRRRVDWQATARNWLRKAAQIGPQRASAAPAPGSALPRPTDHGAWQTAADRYGLRARPGEDWPTFQARIRAFIERAGAQ